jgi:tetratricopeptide (TPR) repeat protein
MSDGFTIVCPACGETADLSAGLAPNENGQLICASCGTDIPIPLAAPDDSLSGTSTAAQADLPTIVDAQHQVQPMGVDTVESMLRDSDAPRYSEQETIGKGGMGEIVLCVERNTRRQVAMKRMLPTAAGHARSRARFIEEAQVTAQLEHPNIVPVHELEITDQGAIYFTMKLVKGRSLAEILNAARDGSETHSLGELLQMFLKVCDGVAFAHSRGVVHRDLKPANIMVGDFGEVLVMDWGIARILGHHEIAGEGKVQSNRHDTNSPAMHTMTGAIMGSPQYMPPEQAAGKIDMIDHRSDIYSLGAILYEILTLKRPFEDGDAQAIMTRVIAGSIHPPEQRTPERDIPRELSAVAMKCLAKYRRKRYASVPNLQRDISLYLEGRSVSAAPDTFAQAIVKLIKRNKGISIALAAATVVLIAVVSVAFVRVTGAMRRAISGEAQAVTAQQAQRATALSASEQLARQAVRAASEGRFAEADVRADAAVKVLPDGPWGHYALGVVAFEKKDFDGARQNLEKATSLDPSHKPSMLLLSSVMAATGNLASLEKLVAQAAGSTDWRSLVAAGDTLMQAERYPQARKAYQRADELIAEDAAAAVNVRLEAKDKLARATGCVKMMGFYESVRKLPGDQQVRRLTAKLYEIYGAGLNVIIRAQKGSLAFVSIAANTDMVRWLDPLRGLPLDRFNCKGASVANLDPLKGMLLRRLNIASTKVSDLTALKGMPLKQLDCGVTPVSDLTPLKGMKLTKLSCPRTRISDLTPLKGMPLESLDFFFTGVRDLSPLTGMPLKNLHCGATDISDLSPLKGMKLVVLDVHRTKVTDLTPLEGMKLETLVLTPGHITKGMQIIRDMKSIRKIGTNWLALMAPEEFWKKYDARKSQ